MKEGNRLNRANFSRFLAKSRKVEGQSVSLRYSPSLDGFTRYSVVVSSKVAVHATHRNLLRRRSYAILRTILNNQKKPLWLVIYLKKAAVDENYMALNKDISELFSKVRLDS